MVVAELERLVQLRHEARSLNLLPHQAKQSLLAGQRASKLRGRGLDFEELRAYVPGDDVRSIDWRVTARARRPFLRLYREERDRPVLLVIDQRPTMFFGSRRRMKSVAAAELAALLAWRTLAQGDRVGALVFGGQETWTLRPERNERSVQRLCETLVTSTNQLLEPTKAQPRDVATVLQSATRLAQHDALVVVISDFRDMSAEAHQSLERLRRHNDLILVWIHDELERRLPDVGLARVSDGFHERNLPSFDPAVRQGFAAAFEQERRRFQAFASGPHSVGFELGTEQDVVARLRAVLGHGGSPT
jgi:uncharacterized protein (DUF58 family)